LYWLLEKNLAKIGEMTLLKTLLLITLASNRSTPISLLIKMQKVVFWLKKWETLFSETSKLLTPFVPDSNSTKPTSLKKK
jgi:hypothetical protein